MSIKLRSKVKKINDILEIEYGIPERSENEKPLDVLIHTILSQNTNDTNSGRAYDNLIERFPSWENVLEADADEIAEAIRVGGLAKQKSTRIKELLTWVKNTYGQLNIDFVCDMDTKDAIELFTKRKGIGLKTINVMLCFACGKEVFPVDTHIFRISKRLALIPSNASPDKAHEIMGKLFPEGKAFSLHVNMINFGRTICHAQRPRCRECPLIDYCAVWQDFIDKK
jgi:endonuclease-3